MKLGLRPIHILALATLVMTAACRERPACSAPALGTIEAAYLAEALEACKGKTRATCEALPAIEAKYATKREEWVKCR